MWGTELALAIRAESDAMAEAALAAQRAEEATQRVHEIQKRIVSASNEETWLDTGSFPSVPDDRPTEIIRDVPCPGDVCNWYMAGRRHAHTPDGEIWDLEFRQTS
jgi:hypothetical protein